MKAMVLGGVTPHVSLIEHLKQRGYHVMLVDYLDSPPAKAFADEVIQESTLDVEKVYELAKESDVDVIMATCVDHANVTMCSVSERLGLPHPYSLETAQLTTNKALMKARMREFGIPTSDYLPVRSVEEVPWGKLTYPLVVKPADNNGSKGVKRVDNDDALREGLGEALRLSRSHSAIIEGFSEGREIQVDCFANYGEAHVLTIREKLKIPRADGMAMQVYGSTVPPELSDGLMKQYEEIAQRIVSAFNLVHTPFFFQSITDGKKISVLELSPRIGGGLSYKIIKDRTGVDIIDLAIDSYFGSLPSFEVRSSGLILASTIVYAVDGVLSRVTGIDELIDDGTIVDWDDMATVGSKFGNYMDSRNRVGAYYSAASTCEELRRKTRRAAEVVDVIGEDGTSIRVKGLYLH